MDQVEIATAQTEESRAESERDCGQATEQIVRIVTALGQVEP
jgi:hypothetical protein